MRISTRKIERRLVGGAQAGEKAEKVVLMTQVPEIRSLCFFFLTLFCILISIRHAYWRYTLESIHINAVNVTNLYSIETLLHC